MRGVIREIQQCSWVHIWIRSFSHLHLSPPLSHDLHRPVLARDLEAELSRFTSKPWQLVLTLESVKDGRRPYGAISWNFTPVVRWGTLRPQVWVHLKHLIPPSFYAPVQWSVSIVQCTLIVHAFQLFQLPERHIYFNRTSHWVRSIWLLLGGWKSWVVNLVRAVMAAAIQGTSATLEDNSVINLMSGAKKHLTKKHYHNGREASIFFLLLSLKRCPSLCSFINMCPTSIPADGFHLLVHQTERPIYMLRLPHTVKPHPHRVVNGIIILLVIPRFY